MTGLPRQYEPAYPSAARAADEWMRLAEEISLAWSGDAGGDDLSTGGGQSSRAGDVGPVDPGSAPMGSLLILGSGIQSIGFTADAEAHLRSADRVFFCVADAPTVGWLRSIRPDAYDLYVLYDDAKPRYHTYVQMTEAMLHYVRRGMKVVAVYYGHPGIFVLSTHRAVRIARREGYRAVMRPGISALDCLCADLGVDPAQPGLQTHEATDLLIRGRRLDTSLHVILWQVGLIGEMGYRRKGFLNNNLALLVEYLQRVYGPHYPVTHYVAARYPTMEPLIATYEMDRLLEPKIRTTLTGISTLYIPPRDAAPVDLQMAIALGLAKAGDVSRRSGPLREIDQYGRRERRAIAQFEGFTVPPDYQYQERTAACRFLIDLAFDTGLQARYTEDPDLALAAYPELSERERVLLATRNEGALQLAAKGKVVTDSPDESLVSDALGQLETAKTLSAAVARSRAERSHGPLRAWEGSSGRTPNWRRLPTAIDAVVASSLHAWTGVYLDESARLVLAIVGSRRGNRAGTVYIGGERVPSFTFANRVLSWDAGPGCASSGGLLFGYGAASVRQATGRIAGPAGRSEPVTLVEPTLRGPAVASWVGRYVSGSGSGPVVEVTLNGAGPVVIVDGKPRPEPELRDGALRWNDDWISVGSAAGGPARLTASLAGHGEQSEQFDAERVGDFIAPYLGTYHAWRSSGEQGTFALTIFADAVAVGSHARPEEHSFHSPMLTWSGARPGATSGQLRLYIDPLSCKPCFSGTIAWSDGSAERVHGIAAGASAAPSRWTLRHSRSEPVPEWAVADLIRMSDPWIATGGLHLHAQWRKANATHLLLRRVATTLPTLWKSPTT